MANSMEQHPEQFGSQDARVMVPQSVHGSETRTLSPSQHPEIPSYYLKTQRSLPARDAEPAFITFQEECLGLFGPRPSATLALQSHDPLYHEAAVYLPHRDQLFVTSNRFTPAQASEPSIVISKLTRHPSTGQWTDSLVPVGEVRNANGAINYPTKSAILFCAQGDSTTPGGLVLMSEAPPHHSTPILRSYHGRWFNSPNDVVLHSDGSLWFTDPIYGSEQGFRPKPQLPNQIYRYDLATKDLRVVADGFGRPNGLCFSPDESTMYITDTDWIHGDETMVDTRCSHIYAFDVIQRSGSSFLSNRRVFAMADTGVPDGIKCDMQGNVYSGCGDGLSIWTPGGTLLGKILIHGGVANFCFGRPGELFLLNEERFWVVNLAPHVRGSLLAGLGIQVEG